MMASPVVIHLSRKAHRRKEERDGKRRESNQVRYESVQ